MKTYKRDESIIPFWEGWQDAVETCMVIIAVTAFICSALTG